MTNLKTKILFSFEELKQVCSLIEEHTYFELEDLYKLIKSNLQLFENFKELTSSQDLTDNQKQFVFDALSSNLDINFKYSGRGMFGDQCPAIVVDDLHSFQTSAQFKIDNFGKSFVLYAQD